MKLKEPQERGLTQLRKRVAEGSRRVVLQSATGGGKTVMACDIMRAAIDKGKRTIFYTHRTMLFEQLLDRLRAEGFWPCVRAPRFRPDDFSSVCLAMIQTDYTRTFKSHKTQPFPADVVIVDECHAHKGKQMVEINSHYSQAGAVIVGLSATPVDIGHLYDDIVTVGTFSEWLDCGLHVPVDMYAPNEPDLLKVSQCKGEYNIAGLEQRFQPHVICGSVAETYHELNPDRRPGLLFAPSVPGSIGITRRLNGLGIVTAHLDGYNAVMPDGTEVKSSRSVREDLVDQLVSGKINLISNRFVLREGIDIPQLYYCGLCTTFGLASYIQACGRLLRAHPSLDHVRIADHGGNYWRHGYVNTDRQWDITMPQHRQPKDRNDDMPKGWRCPNCFHVAKEKGKCAKCGTKIDRFVRAIRSVGGKLRLVSPSDRPSALQKEWDSYYFRVRNSQSGMPFWVFADWFTGKTGHVIDRSGNETVIVGRDGERMRLANAPAPMSDVWRVPVHKSHPRELQ